MEEDLTAAEYRALADFRYRLRRFLHFSEQAARAAGLEPQHHQLLLALKALEGEPDAEPTVGALAERLQLQHHSAVGLVNRLEERELVARERSAGDRRRVLVRLAPRGEDLLRTLSLHHRDELRASGPELIRALRTAVGHAPTMTATPDTSATKDHHTP